MPLNGTPERPGATHAPDDDLGRSGHGRSNSVGTELQSRRKELSWDLADIAYALKIKQEYLAALENNSIDALPGPAYAVGFLKAYADYMGLDGRQIVEAFKRERAGVSAQPELNFPMPLTARGIPGSSLILVALILLLIGYGSWAWFSSGPRSSVALVAPVPARLLPPPSLDPPAVSPDSAAAAEPRAATVPALQPAPSAPIIGGQPATSATGGVQIVRGGLATTAPVPAAPLQTAALPPAAPPVQTPGSTVYGNPVAGQVIIRATADSWIEVLDNNQSVWHGLLKAGDVYNPPKDGLTLKTGNAGGLQITVGGKTAPPVGNAGEVKKIVLDASKLLGG